MTEVAHSRFGASAAHRWMRCPASIQASAGLPNPSSPAAAEGTMLHEVAANLLCNMPYEYILTSEQMDVVMAYFNAVQDEIVALETIGNVQMMVEQKFNIPIHPGFWGTADAILVAGKSMRVFDLKAGGGVAVEVDYAGKVNPQLGFYALGAISSLPWAQQEDIEDVEVIVVQPRLGGIKRRKVARIELDILAEEMLAAAALAEEPDAPFSAGSWCKFCLARHKCPELRHEVFKLDQMDFFDDAPVDVVALDNLSVGDVLESADVIETWLKAVRDDALYRASSGETIPGWKLVDSVSNRKWKNENEAAVSLINDGVEIPYAKPKMPTPAQVEKAIKQAKLDLDIADLVTRETTGVKLVRDTDGRNSAATALTDFAD
jgi:hypothetical protein